MAIMMFTSCLEEGTDSDSISDVGVIDSLSSPGKVMYLSENIYIYSEAGEFADYKNGDCCYVTYALNGDSAMFSTNGYYTVQVLESGKIDQYDLLSGLTDTSKLLPNETAIINPVYGNEGRYVKGRLFIRQQLNSLQNQQTCWNLSYVPDFNDVEKGSNGYRIYDVFLRATITTEGSGTSGSDYVTNAYNMSDYFDSVANIEKNLGNEAFNIRFNYVSAIDTVNSRMTWKQSSGVSILVETILPEE
jgi:hypothetical protein